MQAALVSDPANEELLKLRADLQEVIALTTNLTEDSIGLDAAPSSSAGDEHLTAGGSSSSNREAPPKHWNVGDTCAAQWSEDKHW